jgi:hypothetical protein
MFSAASLSGSETYGHPASQPASGKGILPLSFTVTVVKRLIIVKPVKSAVTDENGFGGKGC